MRLEVATVRGEMGIYQITCKANKKVYVGSSVDIGHRWTCHRMELRGNYHDNEHLQNAWNKYGEDNFIFEVIQPVINLNNLVSIEEKWIQIKDSCNSNKGFNKTPRGNGYTFLGRTHTKETKEKIASKKRGVKQSPEVVEKRRKAMTGKSVCPDRGVKIWETRRLNGKGGRPKHNIEKMSHPVAGYDAEGNKIVEFESISAARRAGYDVWGYLQRPKKNGKGLTWKRTTDTNGVCVRVKKTEA